MNKSTHFPGSKISLQIDRFLFFRAWEGTPFGVHSGSSDPADPSDKIVQLAARRSKRCVSHSCKAQMRHPRSFIPSGPESHPVGTGVSPHRDWSLSHKRLPRMPKADSLEFYSTAGSRRGGVPEGSSPFSLVRPWINPKT